MVLTDAKIEDVIMELQKIRTQHGNISVHGRVSINVSTNADMIRPGKYRKYDELVIATYEK